MRKKQKRKTETMYRCCPQRANSHGKDIQYMSECPSRNPHMEPGEESKKKKKGQTAERQSARLHVLSSTCSFYLVLSCPVYLPRLWKPPNPNAQDRLDGEIDACGMLKKTGSVFWWFFCVRGFFDRDIPIQVVGWKGDLVKGNEWVS